MKELPLPFEISTREGYTCLAGYAGAPQGPAKTSTYTYKEANNSELRRLAQIGLEAETRCSAKTKPYGTEWRSLETWELDPGDKDGVRRVASMRDLDIAVSFLRWKLGELSCELHRHTGSSP